MGMQRQPHVNAHGHPHSDTDRHRHIIANRFTNHNSDGYSHQCANGSTHGNQCANGNIHRRSRLHRRHLERHLEEDGKQ